MDNHKKGPPPESSKAILTGRGGRNESGTAHADRRWRDKGGTGKTGGGNAARPAGRDGKAEILPAICRYCGGVIRLIPAETVYGSSANRLGKKGEKLYQCQNCNARVGCHKGSIRPLGNVANEVLRLKRIEAHQVFDGFWKQRGMSRTAAYKWLAEKMSLPEEAAHIGGFEMDQCQEAIELCREEMTKDAA